MFTKFIGISAAALLLAVLTLQPGFAQDSSKQKTSSKAPEQNPFEASRNFSSAVKSSTPIESARTRCLAKQKVRLEGCAQQPAREREVCEAVAKALISVCEQMNPNASSVVADTLFCKGICALKQCPAGCPIPGGGGTCLGNVCATENSVCDPGVLFDCHCVTSVVGPPLTNGNYCSCSCQ